MTRPPVPGGPRPEDPPPPGCRPRRSAGWEPWLPGRPPGCPPPGYPVPASPSEWSGRPPAHRHDRLVAVAAGRGSCSPCSWRWSSASARRGAMRSVCGSAWTISWRGWTWRSIRPSTGRLGADRPGHAATRRGRRRRRPERGGRPERRGRADRRAGRRPRRPDRPIDRPTHRRRPSATDAGRRPTATPDTPPVASPSPPPQGRRPGHDVRVPGRQHDVRARRAPDGARDARPRRHVRVVPAQAARPPRRVGDPRGCQGRRLGSGGDGRGARRLRRRRATRCAPTRTATRRSGTPPSRSTRTGAPAILIAWRGAHTWVMTGLHGGRRPDGVRQRAHHGRPHLRPVVSPGLLHLGRVRPARHAPGPRRRSSATSCNGTDPRAPIPTATASTSSWCPPSRSADQLGTQR